MNANMVGVAQLARAPDCGSGGRGFESPRSPQFFYLAKLYVGGFARQFARLNASVFSVQDLGR